MANPSKAKGTQWETNVVRYLQAALDDERIERRALHGAADRGDVYGIRAGGLEGIAECKDYKKFSDADVREWRRQTLVERDNADAGFALLVVHRPGKSAKAGSASFGQNHVMLTVADLKRITGAHTAGLFDDEEFVWATLALEDVVALILKGDGDG